MPGSDTPTSILGLNQYQSGDDWNFEDVNADNQRMDRLPPTVCTSATRPTTDLFNGRLIWETDRAKLLFYNLATASWKQICYGDDTGWQACTVNATFAKMAAPETPQVRRVGNIVFLKGGYTNAGMAINSSYTVGALPAAVGGLDFPPPENDLRVLSSSSPAASNAKGFVSVSGGTRNLIVETGATLGAYYKFERSWLMD